MHMDVNVDVDAVATLAERLQRVERLAGELPPQLALHDELRALRAELVRREKERHALHLELANQVKEAARLVETLAQARRRGADTASLYVATHRLHSTLDRGQVLQALEEIVASLLGCEQMAVFELIGTPPALAPVSSSGITPGTLGIVEPGQGMIGQVAITGENWIAGDEPWIDQAGRPVSACVALRVDGEIVGVLALYRLLEHKGRLESSDVELLELLSTHAGTALCATRLRMRQGSAS